MRIFACLDMFRSAFQGGQNNENIKDAFIYMSGWIFEDGWFTFNKWFFVPSFYMCFESVIEWEARKDYKDCFFSIGELERYSSTQSDTWKTLRYEIIIIIINLNLNLNFLKRKKKEKPREDH